MQKCFIFELKHAVEDIAVVYCPLSTVNEQQLKTNLTTYFEGENHLPPDRILFVGTSGCEGLFSKFVSSNTIRREIREFTRLSQPPSLEAICWGPTNSIIPVSKHAKQFCTPDFISQLYTLGLASLFKGRESEAILESRGFLHYIKPSGKHCEKFIRTANVFVAAPEISFVAFCLLGYIRNNYLSYIYTDTAGINGVGYAAVLLKLQIDPGFRVPLVDSFSSHEGARKYEFEDVTNSLFIISASTSSDLERVLSERGIPRSNIVTIFYLGARVDEIQVLCDLTRRRDNPGGWLEPVESYLADKCPLCTGGLRAVRIGGDQFLLGEVDTVAELVKRSDKPDWLETFMSDFAGRKIISCHRISAPDDSVPRELFIDLEKVWAARNRTNGEKADEPDLLKDTEFGKNLTALLQRVVPASLTAVVHVDDLASELLAKLVQHHFTQTNPEKSVTLLSSAKLLDSTAAGVAPLPSGTTLVVGGAVVTGYKLMEISQALRSHSSRNVVTFLIGVSRTSDKETLDEIKSNLTYRTAGRLDSVIEIFVPNDVSSRQSAWDIEASTLTSLAERYPNNKAVVDTVKSRVSTLNGAEGRGLTRLFWESMSGSQLSLRPGFILWGFSYRERSVSQADVYFTVSAVLHRWRERLIGRSTNEHRRVVLSPRNFVRFNDGVIQASMLRCAQTGELDYRVDKDVSASMSQVLELVFRNFRNERGEACLEFLIALASRRLQLVRNDTLRVLDKFDKALKNEEGAGLFLFAQQLSKSIADYLGTEEAAR